MASQETGDGISVTDPYDILGVARDADEAAVKSAYRRHAKRAHPDSGGDSAAFDRLQKAYELLLDPVRRKVFDDTGYDIELAEPVDLQALIIIEKLVTETVLDERQPGSFDPVADMQAAVFEEIRKALFNKAELERHSARITLHLERLEARPGKDVLKHMFSARVDAIAKAISETEGKIEAMQRARQMLDGYSYCVDAPAGEARLSDKTAPAQDEESPADDDSNVEWIEPERARSAR